MARNAAARRAIIMFTAEQAVRARQSLAVFKRMRAGMLMIRISLTAATTKTG
jgi:hypothetical protein